MFLVGVSILIYIIGFFFFTLTYLFPILRLVYLDWISIIFFVLPWGIVLYRMQVGDSYLQTDRLPKWETLLYYIKRDKGIVALKGTRAFSGQSFLNMPPVGIIEHMGKDSVLTLGDKKISLAIENNYTTVEPELLTASQILYELGIHDSYTLGRLLIGQNLNYGDLKLMGQVYINMHSYDENHGAPLLIKEWKEYDGPKKEFKPAKKQKDIREKIEWLWIEKHGNKKN